MGEKNRGESVARALHGAFCRGVTRSDLLDLAARKVLDWGPPFAGAYLYVRDRDRLCLEGAAGPHAARQELSMATDIGAMSDTGEVGTLIRRHDLVLGAIVLRPVSGASFSDAQLTHVQQVADALAALI